MPSAEQDDSKGHSAPPASSSAASGQKRRRRVTVIGGGISGLATAFRLSKLLSPSDEIVLCEGSGRVGGTLASYELDGMLLELGPDAFITDKPAAMNLINELGMADQVAYTSERHRRTFVARDKQLYPVPDGFLMMAPTQIKPLFRSKLFSWRGKLRMLQDLWIAPAGSDLDESLSQFSERRFGREALERAIQPLVAGIYTSDPDRLSVKAALPRIAKLESQYGSVIKGLIRSRGAHTKKQESGARYGLFATINGGMEQLVINLEQALPPGCISYNTIVTAVERRADSRWDITLSDGSRIDCDAVVIAAPSFHAANMTSQLDKELSEHLQQIEYSSSAVLNLILRRADIEHPLDGFGFVVPRSENASILACSFYSVKYPERITHDRVVLRVFVGGALQPDVFDLTDEQIECIVWQDLHTYLGLHGVPIVSVLSRFPRSMPQYNVGHLARVEAIEALVAKHPGLALAGNAYHGVGIPDCIASGERAAAATALYLSRIIG